MSASQSSRLSLASTDFYLTENTTYQIWEHAFYLQYKNVKPDYLAAVWSVINFKEAEQRLQAAL